MHSDLKGWGLLETDHDRQRKCQYNGRTKAQLMAGMILHTWAFRGLAVCGAELASFPGCHFRVRAHWALK